MIVHVTISLDGWVSGADLDGVTRYIHRNFAPNVLRVTGRSRLTATLPRGSTTPVDYRATYTLRTTLSEEDARAAVQHAADVTLAGPLDRVVIVFRSWIEETASDFVQDFGEAAGRATAETAGKAVGYGIGTLALVGVGLWLLT